jgi:hypothetical protein
MWWDVVIDVFMPTREIKSLERIAEKAASGTLPVEFARPEAFKRALNQSGWLADEVIAAGLVTQGKTQSLFRMITGLALLEVLRPRGSVRMIDVSEGRVQNGATLNLAGKEQFPITWGGDPSSDELVELLSR